MAQDKPDPTLFVKAGIAFPHELGECFQVFHIERGSAGSWSHGDFIVLPDPVTQANEMFFTHILVFLVVPSLMLSLVAVK